MSLSVVLRLIFVPGLFVLFQAVELERLAAVGALYLAEVEHVLVDGDGVPAGRAGDLVKGGLPVGVAAAAAAVAFVVVILVVLVVVLIIDYFFDIGRGRR